MKRKVKKKSSKRVHGKHIVILQRGWVVVGDLFSEGSKYWIDNGSVIRSWGTSEGLGQLALNGPMSGTKLDKVTDGTWFHELTIVGAMPCSKNWN
jgi:hypothetical protein